MGIGTLQERTLHAMLKRHLCPNEACHERSVGNYVADILLEEEIIEIQTRSFEKLKPKLAAFLPNYSVTVVYPIAEQKWITWVDPKDGTLSKKRRSPKIGTEHEVFSELWKIRSFLSHPNFHLKLIFLDVEEYRSQNGWSADGKKGSERIERIPIALHRTVDCSAQSGYAALLPEALPPIFTVKAYQKARKCTNRSAARAIYTLCQIGTLRRAGKEGRAYLYEIM